MKPIPINRNMSEEELIRALISRLTYAELPEFLMALDPERAERLFKNMRGDK